MKKITILIGIVLLTLALVACGENNSPTETVSPVEVEEAQVEMEEAQVEEVVQETEVTIETVELAIGKTIPNYALDTLSGDTLQLHDYQGKIVMLNFWATWCPYCVDEMPDLEKMDQEEDVVVLAINSGETTKTIHGFMEDNKLDLEVIVDEAGYFSKTFYVSSLPTTFFINEEGILLGSIPGMMTLEQMEKIIQDIRDDIL